MFQPNEQEREKGLFVCQPSKVPKVTIQYQEKAKQMRAGVLLSLPVPPTPTSSRAPVSLGSQSERLRVGGRKPDCRMPIVQAKRLGRLHVRIIALPWNAWLHMTRRFLYIVAQTNTPLREEMSGYPRDAKRRMLRSQKLWLTMHRRLGGGLP